MEMLLLWPICTFNFIGLIFPPQASPFLAQKCPKMTAELTLTQQ